MKNVDIHKAATVGEIVDRDRQFRIMYIPEIDAYVMAIIIWWVAAYERYYIVEKEDYESYLTCKEKFYEKYSRELSKDTALCFTERFAGAAALRDYDGKPGFANSYPTPEGVVNAFQHYGYEDGVLYARIVWEKGEIYVPPIQAVKAGETYEYPLREKCVVQRDAEGSPICYRLKTEE